MRMPDLRGNRNLSSGATLPIDTRLLSGPAPLAKFSQEAMIETNEVLVVPELRYQQISTAVPSRRLILQGNVVHDAAIAQPLDEAGVGSRFHPFCHSNG
jgi:hypothetical protein